jgi:oxygen-independent coproporphyrinogen-3 oxidase
LQGIVDPPRETSGSWHRNELDEIVACAGPGLPPEGQAAPPGRIRVTPQGRLVLNAVVAKLSNGFQRADRTDKPMDKFSAAV